METLNLICEWCNKEYIKRKKDYMKNEKLKLKNFCSHICHGQYINKKEKYNCTNCNKEIFKSPCQIKKSKSKNTFCCKSCATTYNNKHKKHGSRRSKLEIYIEKRIIQIYGENFALFNKNNIIGSELDIYIHKLKLAFELNGIFHYEPIYGDEKLNKIKNNDNGKFQECIKRKISLCIIDTSKFNYFKESKAEEYFNIVNKIIQEKLAEWGGI